MRVLFVTQSVDAAHPVLAFTRGWVEALARRVAFLDVVAGRGGAPFAASNVRLRAPRGPLLRRTRARLAAWRGWRARPDVVFVHMVPRWAAVALARRGRRCEPVVALWYAHGTLDPWLVRCADRLDRLYTPDPVSCPVDGPQVRCVGHGIAPPALASRQPSEPTSPQILVAGRIAARKGTDVALAIFRELLAYAPSARLLVVGAPLTREDAVFHERLRTSTPTRNVTWMGALEHERLRELYATCDLLLHPSATGSLDKVVLEAWSAGIPALARPAVYGWLTAVDPEAVPASSDPADWARTARSLLALPAPERERRAAARRAHVEREHSLDRLMDAIVRDLELAVAGPRRRP